MVSRKRYGDAVEADGLVEKPKELAELAIEPADGVEELAAVRTVPVTDRVDAREAQREHVDGVIGAERFFGDELLGEVEQEGFEKRRVKHRVVVPRVRIQARTPERV